MQLFAFGFWLQFPKVSFAPTGTIGWDNLNLTAKGLPQLLGGEIIQKAVFFVPEHHFGNTKNIAAQIALALLDDIRSRHKARNADSAANDEWYLLAGREVPPAEFYDNYDQLEDGVGMWRMYHDSFWDELQFPRSNVEPRSIDADCWS